MLRAGLPGRAQIAHNAARDADGMLLALGQVVCHTRGAAVQLCTAQLLRADILPRRGLQTIALLLQSCVCNSEQVAIICGISRV